MRIYGHAVGDLVTYRSPAWGQSTGTVLRLVFATGEVLVQDHHPTGGREYWPAIECEPVSPESDKVALAQVHSEPSEVDP